MSLTLVDHVCPDCGMMYNVNKHTCWKTGNRYENGKKVEKKFFDNIRELDTILEETNKMEDKKIPLVEVVGESNEAKPIKE